MTTILIENGIQILTALILAIIGVCSAAITKKFSTRTELANVHNALAALTAAAQQTVLALQQTTVDDLKAYSDDGRLTREEILSLRASLVEQTRALMSDSTIKLLESARIDINNYILSTGEAYIAKIKSH